MLKFDIGLWGF